MAIIKAKLPLSKTHPKLAKEAEGWDPSTVTKGSERKLEWKCPQGHHYLAAVDKRAIRNQGCPFCSNKKLLLGFNDLATVNPKVAMEADGWDPKSVLGLSTLQKQWKCLYGHSWNTKVRERTRKNLGCPVCANHKILIGFNDLVTTNPEIAQEALGWDPSTVVAGSESRRKWKCTKNHIYFANIRDRTRVNSGCPYCSNHKLLKGFNDLKTTHPYIAQQSFNWDPSTVVAGSSKKRRWKCDEGHTWLSAPASRSSRGDGCPTCANSGFDPNEKGFLYFLTHKHWAMFQIGITNYPEKRLASHMKLGWKVNEIRGPLDGHLTRQWETAILRMLKSKGADLSNSKIAGKFDGYSEAWSKSKFPVKSIKELMRLTEEFEEGK